MTRLSQLVTVYKPTPCDASIAAAQAAVASLHPEERVELAAMLRRKYPGRFSG